MHPLISKNKLYLYLFFLIFLSSIFNFKFLENYQEKFNLKIINISGVSIKEKKNIENELNKLKNTNIFKITETNILENLNKFDFIESIYVKKIIPSSININLSKTSILGKTFINGEEFYIGKNGKFINYNQLSEQYNSPTVFGNFQTTKYLELLEILREHNLDLKKIDKIYFYKNKRWDLLFYNGSTLKLPSKKIEDSIKIYKKMLLNNNLTNTKIIDLRVINQIILTNKNE